MKWVYALLLIGATGAASAQSADGGAASVQACHSRYPRRPSAGRADIRNVFLGLTHQF